MGVAEDVEIDVKGPIELREGDTFILCSDGLHGVVKEDEIREVVEKMPIDAAADEFLRRALLRGAPDNVTVIVARVEIDDGTRPEPEKLEETQKLEAVDLFDETIRDTQPLEAVRDDEPRNAAPPKKNGILKWTVVVVLLLGAAGAWFYWNRQISFQTSSPSSSR
jgi:sulfur transfer complex TusBCD TusB component (DsrH family)